MMKRWMMLLAVLGPMTGCAESAFAQAQTSFSAQVLAANPSLYLTFNNPAQLFRENTTGVSFLAGGTGTILSGQTGFDNKEPNNTAASFPYNSYIYSPNDTLGNFEWNQPFGIMFQIDRLNWARTGTKVLLSKGNITNTYGAPYYELSISMKTATVAQICFYVNGSGGSVAPNAVRQGTCTSNSIDNPNGYNYNLFVTNDGTGTPNSSMKLYVNGLNNGATYVNGGTTYGFGGVTVAIGGSGSGYAATTAFTASGGGANCHVSGTMNATSGVPASITLVNTSNYGCTSVPTLTLTSPTGTGSTLTAALFGASMSSATTAPVYVSGYWDGTKGNGSDTNSSEAAILIDEFAEFSTMPTQAQIQSIYYQTKWYQGLLKTIPTTPYALVFDDDGCGDPDNLYALAVTIGAQKLGYITLAGVVDTDGSGQSMAMYRQMLDQAGLAHIPMSVPSATVVNSSLCTAANINTYNSATPQTASGYPTAASMYRRILAANATTPVFIMLGGSFRGVSDLMQSAADSISSLTGAQLVAQNAANGGAIYIQGLAANATISSDNSLEDWTAGQYVFAHNGSLPIYAYGGLPQASGPGVLSTRSVKDPMYLFATNYGSDYRVAYDSLPTTSFISNFFAGGVTIAIGGSGTGYAASTPFTSSGGGAGCVVTGFLNSTGGVPSSVTYTTGYINSYEGGGYGCTNASSPPTIVLTAPTGTGVTLTATTTASPCGTATISSATNNTTSTSSCTNVYFLPEAGNADSSSPPVLEWFLNSLIDPPPNGAPRVQ